MSPQIFIFFGITRAKGCHGVRGQPSLECAWTVAPKTESCQKKNFLLEGQCVSVIDMSLNAVSGVSIFFQLVCNPAVV